MLSLNDLNAAQDEIYSEVEQIYLHQKTLFFERIKERLKNPGEYDTVEFVNEWLIDENNQLRGMRMMLICLGIYSMIDGYNEDHSIHEEVEKIISDDSNMVPYFRGRLHI